MTTPDPDNADTSVPADELTPPATGLKPQYPDVEAWVRDYLRRRWVP